MAQRLHFLSRGRSLAPVDVMRLEKAVPCFPHTCSGVKCFRFFDCFSAAKLQLQTARSRQEFSNEYLIAKIGVGLYDVVISEWSVDIYID